MIPLQMRGREKCLKRSGWRYPGLPVLQDYAKYREPGPLHLVPG
jgi:hypothetical protein